MATYYFLDSNGTNDWNDPLNWNTQSDGFGTTGTIPGSGDDAVVLAMVFYATSGSPTVTNLTVDGSGTITGISVTAVSTLVQSGGSLGDNCYIVGPVTVASGGIIGGSDNMNFASVTGTLTFSGSGSTVSGSTSTILSVSADVIFGSTWTGTATYISIGGNIIYTYGYSGSINNLTITGSTLYAGYPTLYYSSGGMDFDWNTLSNWYVDSGHTQQAFSIPDSTQDAILNSDVTSDSSLSAVANNITVNNTGMNSGKLWISVTVITSTTFSTDTYYGDGSNFTTLTSPTVTFNSNSYLNSNSSIVGNVNFYDTSSNLGSITGDVTVYSPHAAPFDSSNGNTGSISGTISYSGYPARTVYFYHTSSSENWGGSFWYTESTGGGSLTSPPNPDISLDNVIIEASVGSNPGALNATVGSLVVNDIASSSVFIAIDITCDYANFNDSSYLQSSATITQSSNHGGNSITFSDLSNNQGIINPDSPPVVFEDSSTNDGTIDGDAEVYYPSEKPIGGTVNGTVTYYGWTLYFGGGMNDGDWNNPNNWYLDAANMLAYNDIPSDTIPYQDVILQYSVSASNQPPYPGAVEGVPSAHNLSCGYNSGLSIDNIPIIVDGLATFENNGNLESAATITGDALFEDTSTNQFGTITGTATFALSAAEQMIINGYSGTYGDIEFQYGKGVNGSSILGII